MAGSATFGALLGLLAHRVGRRRGGRSRAHRPAVSVHHRAPWTDFGKGVIDTKDVVYYLTVDRRSRCSSLFARSTRSAGKGSPVSVLARWACAAGGGMPGRLPGRLAAVPWLTRFRWALLIAGGLLLLVSVVLRRGLAPRRFRTAGARYGAGAAVLIVLALGAAVLVNALSVRHNARWDLTENRRQSLSPRASSAGLAAPVRWRPSPFSAATRRAGAPPRISQALRLLLRTGKFTWRMEDPDRSPGLAQRYGVDTYGTVISPRGATRPPTRPPPSRKRSSTPARSASPNALLKLTRDGKRVIYLLRGHGEAIPPVPSARASSQAKEQMEKASYEVKDSPARA